MKDIYDLIVVGGGHAGVEAALISARMGIHTLLLTGRKDAIAQMPCNPSIGGLAKSHLVYEIDALGGEMGYNADQTALQKKTLNMSRGPAVRATRAQCDKKHYAERMQSAVAQQKNLMVVEDTVTDVCVAEALNTDFICEHSIGGNSEEFSSSTITRAEDDKVENPFDDDISHLKNPFN